MSELLVIFEWVMHFDDHLRFIAENYGGIVYAILFLIIFCETGLVVTPFLPGDSLLFVAGTLAANGIMDIRTLSVVIFLAAVLGNTVNYQIGGWIGPMLFKGKRNRFIRQEHITSARAFIKKHGPQAVVLSRFMPVIRTFVPFVAGAGRMNITRFHASNLIGALLWTLLLVGGGYFFGNLRVVQDNYKLVMVSIVVISFLPLLFSVLKGKAHPPAVVSGPIKEEDR